MEPRVVDRVREFGIADRWWQLDAAELQRWIDERLAEVAASASERVEKLSTCRTTVHAGLEQAREITHVLALLDLPENAHLADLIEKLEALEHMYDALASAVGRWGALLGLPPSERRLEVPEASRSEQPEPSPPDPAALEADAGPVAILQAPPLFEELVHLRAERPMAPADRPTTVASESAPDTAAQRSPDRPWWAEASSSAAATSCPIRPAWFPPLEREALPDYLAWLEQRLAILHKEGCRRGVQHFEAGLSWVAGVCRLLQEHFSMLRDPSHAEGGRVQGMLARMCALETQHLRCVGRSVPALHPNYRCAWPTNVHTWGTRFAEYERNAGRELDPAVDAARLAEIERERERLRAEQLERRRQEASRLLERIEQRLERIARWRERAADDRSDAAEHEEIEPLRAELLRYMELVGTDEPLLEIVQPLAEFVAVGPSFRRLRRALERRRLALAPAEAARADDAHDEEQVAEAAQRLASDAAEAGGAEPGPVAAWRGRLAGRDVLLVGGTPRPERCEALEAHLGCRIEWFGNERSERAPLDALQRRIEAGRYALVLLLVRFSSHGAMHALRDVCNAVEVPFVRVESGCGLSSICCSLEDAGVGDAFPFPVGELEAV